MLAKYNFIIVSKEKEKEKHSAVLEKVTKFFQLKNAKVIKENSFLNNENGYFYILKICELLPEEVNQFSAFIRKNLSDLKLIIRTIKVTDIEKVLLDLR